MGLVLSSMGLVGVCQISRFQSFISRKGSPLLKFSMGVCHLGLSNMGMSLPHIDRKWHTPIEKIIVEIIRDVNFYVPIVYRSICQIWGLRSQTGAWPFTCFAMDGHLFGICQWSLSYMGQYHGATTYYEPREVTNILTNTMSFISLDQKNQICQT